MFKDGNTSISTERILEIIAWIMTTFSFFCSLTVLFIIYSKKLKTNLTNHFIFQITISEMINNLTILSSIWLELIGPKDGKYAERMRICYSQIFSGLFSNFYTLFSSLLVSYRVYDLLIQNSKIFKQPIKVKRAKFISLYFSFIVSFLVWLIQMVYLQNYSSSSNKYFRVLACWGADNIDYAVLTLFILFLVAMSYLSIKSYCYVGKYTKTIAENEINSSEDEIKSQVQIERAKAVQRRLIIYPITTIILYFFIIAHRIIARIAKNDNLMTCLTFILYTIPTCLRGVIFTAVYSGAQEPFRKALWELLTCKKCRTVKEIKSEERSILSMSTIEDNHDEIDD